jgi:hypothetical protein
MSNKDGGHFQGDTDFGPQVPTTASAGWALRARICGPLSSVRAVVGRKVGRSARV